MLLTEFPDLKWLQKQSRSNFEDGNAVNGKKLTKAGWPTVFLNTTSFGTERKDIVAPFSVFMNLKGSSPVQVENRVVTLDEDTFCLVNPGQTYDLLISENSNATETFNIHFGENFYQDALANCIHSSKELLNGISNNSSLGEFPIRSFWKDPNFGRMIAFLKQKTNS